MKNTLFDSETASVLELFSRISAIPRCSGNEGKIAAWLIDWTAEQDFRHTQDKAGNVVIHVPASSPEYENKAPVILQSHMDMVCEKSSASHHDFSSDPLRLIIEDDWLRADGTTLGADNGIGMAISLALAGDRTLLRPALELLFTVEEETGLSGARNVDPGMLTGRNLINIDSEETGTFTIGCAGGENGRIKLTVAREEIPWDHSCCRIGVGGLRGGHSGMNIAEKRGNAIKILARILDSLMADVPFQLASIKGGSRSNVIPRDAEAILVLPQSDLDQARHRVAMTAKNIRHEFAETEELSVNFSLHESSTLPDGAFSPQDSVNCVQLLTRLPHGVYRMSATMEGVVETSNNLAIVDTTGDSVNILCLQRSSDMSELEKFTSRIGLLAAEQGAEFHRDGLYPGWQPRPDSPLLKRCQETYRKIHHHEARVTMTHGGLECGILGAKLPGIDMISLGPTIENAHSPQEKVCISSIRTVYDFLRAFLSSLLP